MVQWHKGSLAAATVAPTTALLVVTTDGSTAEQYVEVQNLPKPAMMTLYVANVAAMEALTAQQVADGQAVQTLGYYSPGDGGHRLCHYVVGATNTVDGVQYFNGPAGRFVADDIVEEVTFKQGGCKGDNSFDDWARGVATIALGKRTIIAGGVFKSSDTWTISTAGQEIIGYSTGSVVQFTENKPTFSVTAHKVKIRNVIATGKGASPDPNTNTQNKFVNAVNVRELVVSGCSAINYSFAGIYLQGVKTADIYDNLLWGSITVSHDSSADIMCWGTCHRIKIHDNFCLSDSDVGINVGALMGDQDVMISNNLVCVVDASGVTISPNQRRRCIGLHYATDADEMNYINCTGNICVGSRNAGIYYNGWGGSIVISSNTVRLIACDNVDPGLEGGVVIQGNCRSMIIGFNDISGTTSGNAGGISIYRATAGATANVGSITLIGNYSHDNTTYGLSVYGTTEHLTVLGNHLWNNTKHAVFVASYTSVDASGLRFQCNVITVNNSTACGFYFDVAGDTHRVHLSDNYVRFTGTKGAMDSNAAVYSRYHKLVAKDNDFEGFKSGIFFYNYVDGRETDPDIRHNRFRNLDFGVVARADDPHDLMVVDTSNEFINVTTKSGDGGITYNPVKFGRVHRSENLITIYVSATPTQGTFVVGDELVYTNTTAGSQPSYARCITAGTGATPFVFKRVMLEA